MILCLDCDTEIVDAVEGSENQFCGECLGLEHKGDAVFALNPEADGRDDYVGYLDVSSVAKKKPFVVQLAAQWRDDEGMGDDDSYLCEPLYLTRTAAQKLITLLRKALADEMKTAKSVAKTA